LKKRGVLGDSKESLMRLRSEALSDQSDIEDILNAANSSPNNWVPKNYNTTTGEIISTYSTNTDSTPLIYDPKVQVVEGAYDYLQYYVKNGIAVAYTPEQNQLKKQKPIDRPVIWSNETFNWIDL
jgi:hypothetical protein